MKEIENGMFQVTESGHVFFTQKGFKEFGTLFVCEPLVSYGDSINKSTKLFCIEGMNMLSCLKSPFKQGVIEDIFTHNCPSEINLNTPIIKIKTKEPNALQSL
jgi:Na+-translocating ferredoxin:NAD+ oxidoreductase RnfC subunit